MDTPADKAIDNSCMVTPASKTSESLEMATPASRTNVGVKMVKKKKVNLNTSKTKLKSVPATPVNFSFHNMSIQKQTLRANNKALAQNLAKVKLENRRLQKENTELESLNQEMQQEVRRLRRVVGLKDTEIDEEVQRRIKVHMLDIKKSLEKAAEFMAKSSEGITDVYQKCVTISGSSRQASLSNTSSDLLDYSSNSQRRSSATNRRCSFSLPQAEFLSKADEVAFHRLSDGQPLTAESPADMSIIMEQSVLVEETDKLPMIPSLTTVSESANPQEANISSGTGNGKVTKLPQRILRQTSRENLKALNKTSQNVDLCDAKNDTSKSKPKSKKRINSEKVDQNEIEKKKSCLGEDVAPKTKDMIEIDKKQTRSKSSQDRRSESELITDQLESELGSLSGENFDGLVSGSPIVGASEKVARRETFTLSESLSVNEFREQHGESSETVKSATSNTDLHRSEESVKEVPNKLSKSESLSKLGGNSKQKKSSTHARRGTYVAENPFKPNTALKKTPLATETIETKSSEKTKGEIENPFKPNNTLQRSPGATVESKKATGKAEEKMKSIEKSDCHLKSKSDMVPKTSSSKTSKKPEEKVAISYPEDVENPFKPTRNLLRSPVGKLDSRQFLAKLCNNLGHSESEVGSLPEPSFVDEPTTYFNVDMELTVPISTSDRRSPFVNTMEQISESLKQPDHRSQTVNCSENSRNYTKDSNTATCINESTKQEMKGQNSGKTGKKDENSENENKENRDSIGNERDRQKALVEMRIDKPGKFTFAASRKEADGSRKPVPEKVTSRARSKKKKMTPEKDPEPNLGPDRDLFNFGDRTPTVPLNKILQEKASSVYDLSMNESVIGPAVTLNNFREKNKCQNDLQENIEKEKANASSLNSVDPSGGTVYHLPLKGSPQEKPKQTRGRSKSGTRSKSKSRKSNDSDDEDYVPYKSRSKSKSRKTAHSDDEGHVSPTSKQKSRTRGRSRTRKDNDSERNGKTPKESRSKSPKVGGEPSESSNIGSGHSDPGKKSSDQELSESPVIRKSARTRPRARPVISSEDLDASEMQNESKVAETDVEDDDHKANTNTKLNRVDRKSRSGSVLDTNEVNDSCSVISSKHRTTNVNKKGSEAFNNNSKSKTHQRSITADEKDGACSSVKASEPSNIYYLPLKGSPSESKVTRRTRSQSRSRHVSDSEGEEAIPGRQSVRGRSRSTRSQSRTRLASESECEEQQQTNRSRSRSRSKSCTRQVSESENEENMTRRKSNRSRSRPRCRNSSYTEVMAQRNADDEVLEKKSEEKVKDKCSIAAISVEDSDLDFQNESREKRKSRRQTKQQRESSNIIGSCTDSDHETGKILAEKQLTHNNDKAVKEMKRNENDIELNAPEDRLSSDSSQLSELSVGISSRFVNKTRGRSIKIGLQDKENINELGEVVEKYMENKIKHDVKEGSKRRNKDEKTSEISDSNTHPKSSKRQCNENLETGTKKNLKEEKSATNKENLSLETPSGTEAKICKSSRSVKNKSKESDIEKSVKLKKQGRTKDITETPLVRKDKEPTGEDVDILEDKQVNDLDALSKSTVRRNRPSKTPLTSTETKTAVNSKSMKAKTGGKSSRKKKQEVVCDDQTPKGKVSAKNENEKSSQKKTEKENDEPGSRFASLKRRLTSLAVSHQVPTKSVLPPPDDHQEETAHHEREDVTDSEDGVQSKRGRRTKNTVSYVSVPLNKKLRQGDAMFECKTPISKEKAEKMRIALGHRRTILSERQVQNETDPE